MQRYGQPRATMVVRSITWQRQSQNRELAMQTKPHIRKCSLAEDNQEESSPRSPRTSLHCPSPHAPHSKSLVFLGAPLASCTSSFVKPQHAHFRDRRQLHLPTPSTCIVAHDCRRPCSPAADEHASFLPLWRPLLPRRRPTLLAHGLDGKSISCDVCDALDDLMEERS